MLKLLMYFGLGFVREALVTTYYRAISRRLVYGASIVSITLALLDIFVVAKVIMDQNWVLALMYALGEGTGTFIILKVRK